MMMQMLAAGGMPILTDDKRQPDQDNPRGYFEWEKITRLCAEPEIIAQAEGKAVKVISRLLGCLPQTHEYKVIFMRRNMSEVMRSQDAMYERRTGKKADSELLGNALSVCVREAEQWCAKQKNIALLSLWYDSIIENPRQAAFGVMDFLRAWLYVDPMAAAVDPALYRNRSA